MGSFRRSEWLLGGILAVGLIVVLVMLWQYWNQSNQPPPAPRDFTALEAYALAEPIAQNWDSDAKLVNARTTWNMDAQGEFTKFGWSFVFYSAGQSATALISVSKEGGTSFLGTGQTDGTYRPANVSQWEMDSPDVIEKAMKTIDPVLLESMGEATLTLSLDLLQEPNWTAVLTNLESGKYFSMGINAGSGQTIEIQEVP